MPVSFNPIWNGIFSRQSWTGEGAPFSQFSKKKFEEIQKNTLLGLQ